ncbi:radical SAM protein [Candidatus Binatia bacterium]|nr:radical SAM protein [Candidatus Binatia bacterium]
MLSTNDHDRQRAGLTYVYPVVSRRARGVSIGVNLNPNDACNWRCVYCQVPGLAFGRAPEIDLDRLERELDLMLRQARSGEWMLANVPPEARTLRDVAISGNGEPTSSRQLPEVIAIVERVLGARQLTGTLDVVLITNGSLVHHRHVRDALQRLAALGGEVWFKLDGGTDALLARLNGNPAGVRRARSNLDISARACRTWVQTMALDFGGPTLAGAEEHAYCALLNEVRAAGARLAGVRLYSQARPSLQPEAPLLRALPDDELEALGRRIATATGLQVRVSV